MVKATQRGHTAHMTEVLAAAKAYGFDNPTVLLSGYTKGQPIVVAHTCVYRGETTFRLQTLYKPYGIDSLRPGYGLTVPLEHKQALLDAINAL